MANEEMMDDLHDEHDGQVAGIQKSDTSSAEASGLSASTLKSFRHHPEMENFYRFVYENDLRYEALKLLDQMLVEKRAKKAAAH